MVAAKEHTPSQSAPIILVLKNWVGWQTWKKNRVQKETRQPDLFSFRLQGSDPEKNRVDATLYFLKFQNLRDIRST